MSHKFGRKPERLNIRRQPNTVHWIPGMDVEHPPVKRTPVTWEIFTQEEIRVPARAKKVVLIQFGVMMSRGMVMTSLKQGLKYLRCSIQNEIIIESVDDILITLQNNSANDIIIGKGEPLCFVHYLL